jgi:hypothetical protein
VEVHKRFTIGLVNETEISIENIREIRGVLYVRLGNGGHTAFAKWEYI